MTFTSTEIQNQPTTLERLRAHWHPTLNGDADVMAMKSYDNERVWWLGECGHEWDSSPVSLATSLRRGSSGCPVCAGKKIVVGVNDLASQHPEIACEWHPTLNGNLTAEEVTATSNKDYWWQCPQGHNWHTKVASRTLKGVTCKVCSNLEVLTGFNDIATTHPELACEWHPTKNGDRAAETTRGNERAKAWWQCELGHEWHVSPAMRTTASTGCPACINRLVVTGVNDLASSHPQLIAELTEILPDRNERVWKAAEVTQGSDLRASWKCASCLHEWEASIRSRATDGTGCDKCAQKARHAKNALPKPGRDVRLLYPHLVTQWHPTFNNIATMPPLNPGSPSKYWWLCNQNHAWFSQLLGRTTGYGCPKCSNQVSKPEEEIASFLGSLTADVKTSDRTVLRGQELDIYLPSKNLAVEFNGLYWHSEARGKSSSYHHDKWKGCARTGIQLIQIWEDEWRDSPDQVKSLLLQKLDLPYGSIESVPTQELVVSEIAAETAERFFSSYHIEGFAKGTNYLGLRNQNGELVALSALEIPRCPATEPVEIIRYVTRTMAPGGLAKILEQVEANYQPNKIVAVSDNCRGEGKLYQEIGFARSTQVAPDYKYVWRGRRVDKSYYSVERFERDPLLKWKKGLNIAELASLNSLYRIWDAGKTRWVKVIKEGNTTPLGSVTS